MVTVSNIHSVWKHGLKGRGGPLWLPYLRATPSPYPSQDTETSQTGGHRDFPRVSVSPCPSVAAPGSYLSLPIILAVPVLKIHNSEILIS